MKDYEELKEEISQLVDKGNLMYKSLAKYQTSKNISDLNGFIENYEIWYSKALLLVKQILPDRLNDFVSKYSNSKRKEISSSNYTISDALMLISNSYKKYDIVNAAMPLFSQIKIVRSCMDSFDSKIYNIQTVLQADIFDSEIESASHLLKKGFFRASGAICGVVLEKHFAEVCKNRNIELRKKSPTIADYNDELKDIAYDVVEWRKIQHLGDIRNLCDHNKDREPTKEEVEELIKGTDRVIKTIF